MGKVRGSWGGLGSDNVHGNSPHLVPILRTMIKINRDDVVAPLSLRMAQKHHPDLLVGTELTLEGEKLLARIKYIFPIDIFG